MIVRRQLAIVVPSFGLLTLGVLLVAAGVMSLAWMLLLTLIVFAEKILPVRSWGPRVVGSAFLALGVLVAAGPIDMPWVA